MKRIWALALALALCLTACSGTTAAGTVSTVESSEVSSEEESSTPLTARLSELVENGVIEQDTLNSIIAYLEMNNIDLAKEEKSGDGETPPEKPDERNAEESPEKPADAPEQPQGEGTAPGQKPDGGSTLIPESVLEKLVTDSILTQEQADAIAAYHSVKQGGPGGAPGGDSTVSYTAANTIASVADHSDGVYASETADENALLIDTAETVVLRTPIVTKTGDSDGGDTCSFYGVNAAVLAKGGATVNITGGTVTTEANGANGVFSYGGNGGQNGAAGDGTTVKLQDTVITTTGDNAGGIMTTGGGITEAENLTIETSGRSSAAIRTDRGGGTVTVTGGSYTTNGLGSPAIYSTASVSVSNAVLTSNRSEGVCIEGKNSVTLTDCDLTASNTETNGNATFLDSVLIYQSMSGDAASGTSSFTMTGGSLTGNSGHLFHVTNTNAEITLSGVAITNTDSENVLLSVCDDGWSGSENTAVLSASAQELSGKILAGENSSLTLELADGSVFTGEISGSIQNSRGETVSSTCGTVAVTLDASSAWTLTGDSYITSFTGDLSQVTANGFALYVNGEKVLG